MKRLPGFLAIFSLAVAGACGGGDKGGDTTPAATAPPDEEAPPAVDEPAPAAGEAPAAGQAVPEGPGLTEQIAQGEKVWVEACAICHGDNGEGKGKGKKKTPAVVGAGALGKYESAGDLLRYLKEKMPKDDPGSLSESDYLAVTAWTLGQNGKLGDGNSALTAESAASLQL